MLVSIQCLQMSPRTACSKTEQMATVIRYVNIKDASIHERFLTFVEARSLDAEGLTKYMLDTLKDYHLDLESIVSQGYYGTSMMSGRCAGVQKRATSHLYPPFCPYFEFGAC